MKTGSSSPSNGGRPRWRPAIVVAAAGLVVISACGSSSSSSSVTSTATEPAPEYAEKMGPVLAELVESMQVPSAVVVVRSSEFGDATFRFGSKVLGGADLPDTSDHYRIGSITKTMTATVILQLVQEGKLSLDDPISKYRTGVPNGDNITIAELLDMRSGLAGYTESLVFQRAVDEDPDRVWSPDQLLSLAFSAPASFPPGAAWQYSNTNYILLGLVMEDVTGKTASELFQERLFDPLGMDATVMPTPDDASMPAAYAHGYQFGTAEKTFGPDPALSADQQQAAAGGELLPADWSAANPSIAWTAGSVISTADDLVVWTKALVDGELLDPGMQAQRLASIQPIDPAQPDGPAYGSGMIRANSYFGHAGQISGYESQVIRDPETDTTIVALAGLSVSPDGRGPASELSRAVRLQLTETAAGNTGPHAGASFAGLVDIGGGRQVYLECQGRGSPTVVLVSGTQGAHDDWTDVADTNSPGAAPQPSGAAVFPQVSRFTRVCALDRPGTTLMSGAPSPSTPVDQPTPAAAGVADLAAVLGAAHEPGPYVLVGASWGGMVANLYARTHASSVAGLVFVDAASEFLNDTLSPAQWTAWMQLNQTMPTSPTVEIPDYPTAVDEIRAAPALPNVPAAVLTADQPWNLPLGDAGPTWPAWTAAQDRLASLLHASHITQTDSGHPINIDQPQIVTDAVQNIVTAARQKSQQPH